MSINTLSKKLLLVCACATGAILLARFCHHQTQGFRLTKIQSNLIKNASSSPISPEENVFLSTLFQQKFHFLGRGLQSFVFASEDGNYVLKVFNNRYQQKIGLFSFLTPFPWLGSWASEQVDYYNRKLHLTFASYQIAYDEMREQTGLLYLHLKPTNNLPSSLQLVDKLNITHCIDPNSTGFLIQKRARLVFPTLKEYIQQGDLESAQLAISSLVNLFFWKWQHAILDNDPLIRTNYGFIDGKAIQIDVGPLSKAAISLDFTQQSQEILHITASLKAWLAENSPELIAFLDRELQQQLSSRE